MDIIPNPSFFAESTNYFDLNTVNTINQVFVDNDNDNAVSVNGKINYIDDTVGVDHLNFFRRFRNPQIPERQRVFFLGQHSKRWGYVKSNDAITNKYKRYMIECDLKLTYGDSGGLLFYESDVQGKLIALGVLSMIDVIQGVSYFTSLSVCFEPNLFELQ